MAVVIGPATYYLPHPLADIWTGVTVLADERLILIDTATQAAAFEGILPFLRYENLADGREAWVINTHCHCDHIGGNAALKQAIGAQIAAHQDDAAYIEDRQRQFEGLFGAFANDPVLAMNPVGFMALAGQDTPIDRILRDGDRIETGARMLRVIHTPGHSPGSIALFDESAGVLYAGDSVQCDGTTDTKVPLIVDAAAYRVSINTLVACDARTIVVDHPFKPYTEAILRGNQVTQFLQDSLAALDRYAAQLAGYRVSRRDQPVTVRQVASCLADSGGMSINPYLCMLAGALLDEMEGQGATRRLSGEGYDPAGTFLFT